MSVPTKSIQTKVERVLKMLKIKDKVKTTEINEYNTTQCCYKCDAKMNILLTKTGNDCLRYRLCTCCSTKTYGKRRNRDVNADKNMLRLLRLEMDGSKTFTFDKSCLKYITRGLPYLLELLVGA
jgi:hypothetical protein